MQGNYLLVEAYNIIEGGCKGNPKMGNRPQNKIPWNKGLTKEDPRVAACKQDFFRLIAHVIGFSVDILSNLERISE